MKRRGVDELGSIYRQDNNHQVRPDLRILPRDGDEPVFFEVAFNQKVWNFTFRAVGGSPVDDQVFHLTQDVEVRIHHVEIEQLFHRNLGHRAGGGQHRDRGRVCR